MLKRSILFLAAGAALSVALIVGMSLTQKNAAVAQEPAIKIGIVRYDYLLANHPEMIKANESLDIFQKQQQVTLDEKLEELTGGAEDLTPEMEKAAREMFDSKNQAYLEERRQKEMELYKPIIDKVNALIEAAAKEKGVDVVLDQAAVIIGGVDLTEEIIKKIAAAE